MISLSKMKEWFETETENSVKRLRTDITKRIEIIQSNFEELKIAAQDFELSDTVDAESRSSQNIYEKMTEMVNEFVFPTKITYKTASSFSKDLEKFLQRVLTIGQRFIPNLKRKYRTRVFILNRALTRIQKNYQEFSSFLEDKTQLLQDVDSTSDNIELLINKVKDRENLKSNIVIEQEEANKIKSSIDELKTTKSGIETNTILNELDEITKELDVIGKKLRLELGGLDKPLRKLTSRALDGKVMVPPDLILISNLLKDDPIEALRNQDENYTKLKDLMEILIEASNKDKIQLKGSLKNKTISLAEDVLKGSLVDLQTDLLNHINKQKEIEKRVEETGLKEKIQEFKEQQENMEKEMDRKNRRIKDLEEELEKLNKEIVDLAADTQRNVRKLTGQDVKINIKE
ncbi:MAG: hypothetical protein FK734_11670 [Asgard group archaeon]|nr:hypothetical protein [Asgard group archaeon]